MKELNLGTLSEKMSAVQRGAYYFGIIGRLSILYGAISLIMGIPLVAFGGEATRMNQIGVSCLVGSLPPLVNGWLFLMGRDAFEAIQLLIKEAKDIV